LVPNQTRREYLLEDLCVRFGLCLSPDDQANLLLMTTTNVAVFTDAVFRAEGIPSGSNNDLHTKVCEVVAKAFEREP
jgi:hypothetical protein